jgi:WD40 repeat protein
VKIWDINERFHICSIDVEFAATSICFAADGKSLAIGNEKGELIILASDDFNDFLFRPNKGKFSTKRMEWRAVDSKIIAAPSGSNKHHAKKLEITEIKYSPTEDVIAVGSKDGFIHILSLLNGFKHVAVCRGHTSFIKNIDFSQDGRVIKSTDASRELLFWDVATGQRITNSAHYRELQWHTFTCIYGWSLQGIFNRFEGDRSAQPDSEINCLNRSPDGQLIACGGSHIIKSAIKLFQYPAISDAIPSLFGGHTSPVLDMVFTGRNDNITLISAGGNDSCVFLWDVISD